MNKRPLLGALLLAAGLTLANVALPVLAQVSMVPGEVIKIDKPAARLTLKHGEIKSLDMPPMTMIWRVQSPALLDDLAVGDRVRFVAERINGQYTVTAINKAPQ